MYLITAPAFRQNFARAEPRSSLPLIAGLALLILAESACGRDPVAGGTPPAPTEEASSEPAAAPAAVGRQVGDDTARWRALVVYTPNPESEYGESVCSAFAQGLTWEGFGADLVAAGGAEPILTDYDLFVFCGDPLAEVGAEALEGFADERLDLEYAPAVAIVTGPYPDLEELDELERALQNRGAVLVGSAALGTPTPSIDGPEDGPSLDATLLDVERFGQSVGAGEFDADLPHR